MGLIQSDHPDIPSMKTLQRLYTGANFGKQLLEF